MEIVAGLTGVLEFESVLGQVLESLFHIFPQAERGFFLFEDTGGKARIFSARGRARSAIPIPPA